MLVVGIGLIVLSCIMHICVHAFVEFTERSGMQLNDLAKSFILDITVFKYIFVLAGIMLVAMNFIL